MSLSFSLKKTISIIKKTRKSFRNFLIDLNKDLYKIDNHFHRKINFSDHYLNIHFHVIAIEDRRFFNHYGIDIKSVIRELYKAFTFRNHGGASTIDMQLVRTITNRKNKTFKRKIREIILAIAINRRYSKIEILNCYLSYAYFGAHMNGLSDAMFYMFRKKDAKKLTIFESSIIAAMLQQPRPKYSSLLRQQLLIQRALYAQNLAIRIKDSFN